MNVHMHARMLIVQTTSLQLYDLQLYENSDPSNVVAHLGWFSHIYEANMSVSNKSPYNLIGTFPH